jgi:hypothetical protein
VVEEEGVVEVKGGVVLTVSGPVYLTSGISSTLPPGGLIAGAGLNSVIGNLTVTTTSGDPTFESIRRCWQYEHF